MALVLASATASFTDAYVLPTLHSVQPTPDAVTIQHGSPAGKPDTLLSLHVSTTISGPTTATSHDEPDEKTAPEQANALEDPKTTTPQSRLVRRAPSRQDSVRCMQNMVPIGVLGFYSFFVDFLMLLYNTFVFIRLWQKDKTDFELQNFLLGLVTIVRTAWSFAINVRAVTECSPGPISDSVYGGAGGTFVFVLVLRGVVAGAGMVASFIMLFGRGWGSTTVAFACAVTFFSGCVFYRSDVIFTTYLTQLEIGPVLAVSVPLAVVFLLLVVVAAMACAANEPGAGAAVSIFALIVPFHLWAVGMGQLTLASVINDPWGAYILHRWEGKVEAVLVPVAPILGFILGWPQLTA